MHLLFMGCLLTALVLAARSGQPREYSGTEGVIQGVCEAISLLYIILWLVVTFLLWLVCIHSRKTSTQHNTTKNNTATEHNTTKHSRTAQLNTN